MPSVSINILKNRTIDEKNEINEAIHKALVGAFKIPDYDYNHRIFEFEKDNWIIPKNKSENFIQIEISVFPGRSRDSKKKLYEEIVKNLSAIGIEPMDVLILLNEPPLENWGLRGGKPADEVEFDFEIKV